MWFPKFGNSRTQGWRVAILVVCAGCLGCSRTGNISGVVSFQSQRLAYGNVKLLPSDGIPRDALIGADGSYRFEGIPTGPGQVSVFCAPPEMVEAILQSSGRGTPGKALPEELLNREPSDWLTIPEHYSDWSRSGLTLDVLGGEQAYDIDLE